MKVFSGKVSKKFLEIDLEKISVAVVIFFVVKSEYEIRMR